MTVRRTGSLHLGIVVRRGASERLPGAARAAPPHAGTGRCSARCSRRHLPQDVLARPLELIATWVREATNWGIFAVRLQPAETCVCSCCACRRTFLEVHDDPPWRPMLGGIATREHRIPQMAVTPRVANAGPTIASVSAAPAADGRSGPRSRPRRHEMLLAWGVAFGAFKADRARRRSRLDRCCVPRRHGTPARPRGEYHRALAVASSAMPRPPRSSRALRRRRRCSAEHGAPPSPGLVAAFPCSASSRSPAGTYLPAPHAGRPSAPCGCWAWVRRGAASGHAQLRHARGSRRRAGGLRRQSLARGGCRCSASWATSSAGTTSTPSS